MPGLAAAARGYEQGGFFIEGATDFLLTDSIIADSTSSTDGGGISAAALAVMTAELEHRADLAGCATEADLRAVLESGTSALRQAVGRYLDRRGVKKAPGSVAGKAAKAAELLQAQVKGLGL